MNFTIHYMFSILLFVITAQVTLRNRRNTLPMYNKFFKKIRKAMEQEQEDLDIFDDFEQEFYTHFNNKRGGISSSTIDLDVSSEINTIVNAYKYDEKLGTYAYGTEQNNQFIKILISGAKGTKSEDRGKQISTLALSEIVEQNQTANAIVYASKISDTDYIIDAKINEAEGESSINEKGQFIMCKSVGRRYIFDSLKTALARTKMYRLAIGSDYLKFEINLLIAGAAVKSESVVSKSSIKVMAYIISDADKKVRTNIGLFTSENKTDKKRSISQHFGFLRIDKSNSNHEQETASHALADEKSTAVSAYFIEFLNLLRKNK